MVILQVESLKTALGAFAAGAPLNSPALPAPSGETQEMQTGEITPSADLDQQFTGNKRALVTSIVESRASEGVTPKEIDGIFAERKISKGRNLIYNVLSLSVQDGKMRRENGKYYPVTRSTSSSKKTPRRG